MLLNDSKTQRVKNCKLKVTKLRFVSTCNLYPTDSPTWLSTFIAPCTCWDGLNLLPSVVKNKRVLMENGRAALLDLRNYLFARQCVLLFTLKRPWEVALRAQTFLHNCVQELKILEVGSFLCNNTPGRVAFGPISLADKFA